MRDTVRTAAVGVIALGVAAIAAPATAIAPGPSGGTISQITVSPASETEANGNGRYGAKVSDDGRFVAFWSYSPSIAADDDNGTSDVFLYDATTGLTKLISRNGAGEPANGGSSLPQLSANGKYIAFTSWATDLADGSTEGLGELVYRYKVSNGRITLVSKSPSDQLPTAFASASGISATGRYITYSSRAHNIVPGDHNSNVDVFRYDAVLDETIRVSQTLGGQETDKASYAAAISGNGRFVAYSTNATNMGPTDSNNDVDAYVYDVQTDTTTLVSHAPDGHAVGGTPTGISNNGKIVSLTSVSDELAAGDADELSGAFVYNAGTDRVKLVSLASNEWPDGVIAFSSGVSANGRYLTYHALPDGDFAGSDVYLFDRKNNLTTKISVTPEGQDADAGSGDSSLSRSGNYIGFCSAATTLVPGDTHGNCDIFLWSRTMA